MDEKRTEEEARELTPEEIDDMIFEEQIASGEHMWRHRTSPAANANRGYISNMTLLAIFPWMN